MLKNFPNNLNLKTLKFFLIIGLMVFLLDYVLYQIATTFFTPFNARLISYSISTWFAWRMNGRYSFPDVKGGFVKYFIGASAAGIQNIFLSIYLIHLMGSSFAIDLISIGFACVYGLFFNFLFQSLITFGKR